MLRRDGNWTKVNIGGVTGWMMTEFLAFGDDMKTVKYAGPSLQAKSDATQLYFAPDKASPLRMLGEGESFYVLGIIEGEWYHIWMPYSAQYAYVEWDALTPGNG